MHASVGSSGKSSWNRVILLAYAALGVGLAHAQSTGNSMVSGTVLDPSGAVVGGATVEMHNPVSGFSRSTTTDSLGKFSSTF